MPDSEINELKTGINNLTQMIITNNDNLNVSIAKNHVKQTKIIGEVKTSVAVLQTQFENRVQHCGVEFAEIDSKLQRDYDKINDIVKKDEIEEGVEKFKKESYTAGRDKTKFAVYIIGAILAILISFDKVSSIYMKSKGISTSTVISHGR